MIRLTEEDRMQERQKKFQEGTEKSIHLFIDRFKKFNISENEILKSLITDFKLTPEQARKYLG